jgi:signal transduction histidine kinase
MQLILAAVTESDFLYLLVAEAGFVLGWRRGLPWLAGAAGALGLSFLPIARQLAATAHPVCNLSVAPPPVFLDLATDYVQEVVLQAFAYCIGYFAHVQGLRRRALAQAHVELLEAQHALSEAVRHAEQQRIAVRLDAALGMRATELDDALHIAAPLVPQTAIKSLQTAQTLTASLAGEIGQVSSQDPPTDIPLARALSLLCEGVPEPIIELAFDPVARIVSPALAHAVLRSVQEAISNVVRHSGAAMARVAVEQLHDGLSISVHDDGHGAGNRGPGNGLSGMRERIAALGGHLQVGGRAGGGFAVDIWLPMQAEVGEA